MAGRNSYDLTVERGIRQRHWATCSANKGKRCTCQPRAYIASATVDGKRIFSPTMRHIDDARAWRGLAIAGGLPDLTPKPAGELFSVTWDRWLESARSGVALSKKRKPYVRATIDDYASAMRTAVLPILGDTPTATIDTTLTQTTIDRLALTLSPSRVDSALNAIAAVKRWAAKRGIGEPIGAVEHAQTDARTHVVFTPDEITELLASVPAAARQNTERAAAARRTSRAAAAIAAYADLRAMEIVSLDAADIDRDQGQISVRAVDEGAGKTDAAERLVPIVDALAPYLDDLPDAGPLFTADRRPRSAYRTITQHLNAACGDDGPTLHVLRHNMISWMFAASVPLPALQKISGHKTPLVPGVSLGVYGHAPDGHVEDARQRLNVWIAAQSIAA